MKICPECGRSYADDAVVCAYDGFALSAGSTTDWSDDSEQAPPESGDVLGVYRILDKIDEGGMGIIFRAEHVRLGRQVALKVLKTDLAQRTDVVRRFFEEARAVNEIGHPNIVDIIDFIEVSDQSPPLVYMVMELLKGQDLGRRVRVGGPVPPEDAVHMACQICDALYAVHRVKILHRDLKPENIYLAQTPEGNEKVKLLDFGVAKAFGERQKVRITDPGITIGTPEFMAPEQILGKEMDERTDIYALGMVLYDMLCGSTAFQSSNYGELMVAQVKEAPPPLSERIKEGTLPLELEQAVMRCLEKKPQDRFQNVRDLKSALLSAMGLSAESLGGLPQTTASREVLVAVSGRPWLRVALGLAAVLVVGIIAVVLLSGKPEQRAQPTAEAAKPPTPATETPSTTDMAAPVDQTVAKGSAPDLGADASPATAARKRPSLARSRRPRGKKQKEHKEPRPKRKPSIERTLNPFAQ